MQRLNLQLDALEKKLQVLLGAGSPVGLRVQGRRRWQLVSLMQRWCSRPPLAMLQGAAPRAPVWPDACPVQVS